MSIDFDNVTLEEYQNMGVLTKTSFLIYHFKNKTLKERIKFLRKLHKLTQVELGEAISRTEASIRKYEKGTIRLTFETILYLCEVFNVQPVTLLVNDDEYKDEMERAKKLFESEYSKDGSVNAIDEISFFKRYIEDLGIPFMYNDEIVNKVMYSSLIKSVIQELIDIYVSQIKNNVK